MIRKLVLGILCTLLCTSLGAVNRSELGAEPSAKSPQGNLAVAASSALQSRTPSAGAQYAASRSVSSVAGTSYSASPLYSTAKEQNRRNVGNAGASLSVSSCSGMSSAMGASSSELSLFPYKVTYRSDKLNPVSSVKIKTVGAGMASLPSTAFSSTSCFINGKDEPSLSRADWSATPVRRVGWGDGDNNGGGLQEPMPDEKKPEPVGETPFFFMALLLMAFMLCKYRKRPALQE